MKAGFVAILGRPNVGKSTLLNALLSKRVSIVSPKAQTTRDDIVGVYNGKDLQIAFIDTPGLFDGEEALYKRMNRNARRSLSGVDAVLYLVDASTKDLEEDIALLASIKVDAPIFIVYNKIDLVRAPEALAAKERLGASFPNYPLIEASILTNFGLSSILEAVKAALPEGLPLYPEGQISDKDDQFFAKESIRQYMLRFLHEEVPHEAAVLIKKLEKNGGGYEIEAVIYVEKPSQKAIVIGRGGAMIKQISMSARRDLEKRWKAHVRLDVRVEVLKNWRADPKLLSYLGYDGK